jgi:hypothetical protein
MVKATFTIPKDKLKTIKVWAGMYGGHYDAIVFFKEKPELSEKTSMYVDSNDGHYYNCFDNKDKIIGCMSLGQFYEYFPDADLRPYTQQREDTSTLGGRPLEVEVHEVFEMEITVMIDEHGDFDRLDFNLDGYV